MSIPTEQDLVAAFQREFPECRTSEVECVFLALMCSARSHGVGYGWMRQAIGLAWKTEDPVGYMDDDRLVALHSRPRAAREGAPLAAARFARALLSGVNGAPLEGTELHESIWRWVARQLEAWEQDVREDERRRA